MGSCCSCCCGDDEDDSNHASSSNGKTGVKETELSATTSPTNGKSFSISRTMSSPNIEIERGTVVSGHGLALAGVLLEQDAAYFEIHVDVLGADDSDSDNSSSSYEVLFGVATKKDRKFYHALHEQEELEEGGGGGQPPPPQPAATAQNNNNNNNHPKPPAGTEWMRPISVRRGDVVGIAVQQSDLPMVQFLVNGGEPLHSLAVNRFRGNVYPAVYLPHNVLVNHKLQLTFVFEERDFQQLSPHARFGPVIVARGLL